jgi:hypothetical protein
MRTTFMRVPLLVVMDMPPLSASLWPRIAKIPGMVKSEEAACGSDAVAAGWDFPLTSAVCPFDDAGENL